MRSFSKLKINEIHSVYIDALEEWVDVPVYEPVSIGQFVANITDWNNLTLLDYKAMLIDTIELESKIRSRLNTKIRDEIYSFIISKNPGLAPRFSSGLPQPFYTKEESNSIMEWFASRKIHGQRPEVISDEGER